MFTNLIDLNHVHFLCYYAAELAGVHFAFLVFGEHRPSDIREITGKSCPKTGERIVARYFPAIPSL
jgi:hypothetical protein